MKSSEQQAIEILRKPYARVLIPDESGGYFAKILEFPGCYAEGETPNEAIQNLESVAESWIEATLGLGQDIPEALEIVKAVERLDREKEKVI